MAKAEYEWGCGDSRADDYLCVMPFGSEPEARAHVASCSGDLMVRRIDKDRDWEVVDDALL